MGFGRLGKDIGYGPMDDFVSCVFSLVLQAWISSSGVGITDPARLNWRMLLRLVVEHGFRAGDLQQICMDFTI